MAAPNDNSRKLADDFYEAKDAVAKAEARLAAIRQQIIDTNLAVIEGACAVVTVDISDLKRFDNAKLRTLLTPKQLAECTIVKPTMFVRVKAKAVRASKT